MEQTNYGIKFNYNGIDFKVFTNQDVKYIQTAVDNCSNKIDWYVLRYDCKTGTYENHIIFKTLEDAIKEFNATSPNYTGERVELIFSPMTEDHKYNLIDNCVANFKM